MIFTFILLGCAIGAFVGTEQESSLHETSEVFGYDEIEKMIKDPTLQGNTFNKEEAKNAYERIRYLVENSSFYDDFKSKHENIELPKPMDQIAWLDEEIGYKSGEFTKDYTTAYEFNDAITKAFVGFKDAHQTCEFNNSVQSGYKYTLSFVPQPIFVSQQDPDSGKKEEETQFIFQKVMDSKYSKSEPLYYSYYKRYIEKVRASGYTDDNIPWACDGLNGPESLEGKKILYIAGIPVDDDSTIQNLTPYEFFDQYSATESNYSKDRGADILYMIYNLKSVQVGTYGMPKYKGLRYTISTGDQGETKTCDIPYVFTNESESMEREPGTLTECTEASFSEFKVLVDERDKDDKWCHLSIWKLNDDSGQYTALLVLESMLFKNDKAESLYKKIKEGLFENRDNITRLVVDVRGNKGGNPAPASYLTSLFNWDIPEPHSRFLRMKATDYNSQIPFKSLGFNEVVYDAYDHRKAIDKKWLFYNTEALNFTDANNSQFQSNYTKIFTPNADDIYIGGEYNYSDEGELYGEALSLDPVDVVIITDGRCGSACSTFYWNAYKNKFGRILNVGKMIIKRENEPVKSVIPSAGSFSGGIRYSVSEKNFGSHSFQMGYIAAKEYLDENNATPLEFMFGESDIAGDPWYQKIYRIMSLKDEYPVIEPNTCLNEWCNLTHTECPTILENIKKNVFDKHDWEENVRITDARRRGIGDTTPVSGEAPEGEDPNWIYGYEWNKWGDYMGTLTEKLYCKAGYYGVTNGDVTTCKKLPNYEDDIKTMNDQIAEADKRVSDLEQTNTAFMVCMIVFCILFVASIVVLLLVLFGVISLPVVRASKGKAMVEDVHQIGI